MEIITFKENPKSYAKEMFLNPYSFAGMVIMIWLMLGENILFPFLLIGLCVFIFSFFLFWFLFALFRKEIILNDKEEKIIITNKISGKKFTVDYSQIKSIQIKEKGRFLLWIIIQKESRKNITAFCASSENKKMLIENLQKRFSNLQIKIQSRAFLFFSYIAVIIPVVFLGCLNLYLYQKCPQLKIFPQKWNSSNKKGTDKIFSAYTINNFEFILPQEVILKEEKEYLAVFASEDNKATVVVEKTSLIDNFFASTQKGKFYKFAFGLLGWSDDYDLFKVFYGTRVGIVPLIFKAICLSSKPESIKIYEIKKENLRGFLVDGLRGEEGKKIKKELLLADKINKKQIRFIIGIEDGEDASFVDSLIEEIK